jgi:hypothetical protein
MTEEQEVLPDWWPEWMSPPDKYPLGHCSECLAQQYSMTSKESHQASCSHWEDPQKPGPTRKVPWPKMYIAPHTRAR